MSTTSLRLDQDGPGGNPEFRLEVGGVLQRTFRVWAGNLFPFCVVGLIAYIPAFLTIGLLAAGGASDAHRQQITNLVTNLMTLLLTGAVTYGVFRDLSGQRTQTGELLSAGWSRFGAVFGTGLLMGIAVGLGFVCLIVPGLVLLTQFWVAVPVTVIEQSGASASLSRSGELTKGNRWRVLAIALLMVLVVFASGLVLGVLALIAKGVGGAWIEAASTLLLIPIQCLSAIAPVVAYHDLRVGREGVDVEELLKVFD